jgi:hypothetical protein
MKGQQESLTTVVIKQHGPAVPASWPTPNCMDVITPTRDLTQMESKGHWGKSMNTGKLSEMVNYGHPVPASGSTDGSRPEWWQTATVSTGAHRQKDGSMTDKLDQQVKQSWPTPASAGVTGGPTGLAGGSGNREKLASMLPDAEARAMGCGKLNPRWVCTLMNVPVFWVKP